MRQPKPMTEGPAKPDPEGGNYPSMPRIVPSAPAPRGGQPIARNYSGTRRDHWNDDDQYLDRQA